MLKFILSLIFLSPFSYAQQMSQPKNVGPLVKPEDYRWLYEELFSDENRQNFPTESFKSFRVHLLDSKQNFPKPKDMVSKNLKPAANIQGQITYASIIRKWYKYDIVKNSKNELVHTVKIHFINPSPADLVSFTEKLEFAQNMWNQGRIQTDFKYSFKST